MSPATPHGVRRRRVPTLCATAIVGLTIALLAPIAATTAAPAAAPREDCAAPFPVAELQRGAPVRGLTVSSGTTPEEFTGEVLGVLDDGIAPGLDMIMVDLASPALEQAGGVWAGMSGSPVYAEDGRLIGAVAYGLTEGNSSVAGLTPFEEMDDYLNRSKGGKGDTASQRVRVNDAQAAMIASADDQTTKRQAKRGFEQLPMPLGYGGVNLNRFGDADRRFVREYVGKDSYRLGRSASQDAAPIDSLVAGGNLAAAEALGDISIVGVGTVTSVCGDRMVGFGHPMSFNGRTSLGLGAADALFIQDNSEGSPFKVANIGEIGGTITDDRTAGIAGTFGPLPNAVPFTSAVTFGDQSRTGTTNVMDPAYLALVAFLGNGSNQDRVLDGLFAGTEVQDWLIKGVDQGKPFTLRYSDRFQSDVDLVFKAGFDLADLIDNLIGQGIEITEVQNVATISEDPTRYRIGSIEQKVGGKWVAVDEAATVKAGKKLTLRVQLTGGEPRSIVYSLNVAKRMAGTSGALRMSGGNNGLDDYYLGKTLAQIRRDLATRTRNDEVRYRLNLGGLTVSTSEPQPAVINGRKRIRINVR